MGIDENSMLFKITIGCFIWFFLIGDILMDYSQGWKLLTAFIPGVFLMVVIISGRTWYSDKYRDDDGGDGDGGGGY